MLAFRKKTSFPAELIDELIELVGDSTPTLLSLGLVCKRTLTNTRSRLFSVLEFTNADSFNRFLHLAGAPWTSFTSSVREIHLQDLFRSGYWYHNEKDPRLLAASSLCNVKSLSITSHSSEGALPDLVLEFIFHLKIRDLQLDGVAMWDAGQIIFLVNGVPEPKGDEEESIALLTRLPPTVETLAFRNLRFDDIPKLSPRLPLFQRPIRFRMLDSISLALFKEVFDPLTLPGLNVAVKTFHILSHDSITAAEARTRSFFTRRFLHHVGHSIEQLLVTLNTPRRIISKCASMSNVLKNHDVNFNREYTPVLRPISTFPLYQPSDDIFYIQPLDAWRRVILTCIGHVEDAICLAFAEYSRGMLAEVHALYIRGTVGLIRISRVSQCPSEISADVPKA